MYKSNPNHSTEVDQIMRAVFNTEIETCQSMLKPITNKAIAKSLILHPETVALILIRNSLNNTLEDEFTCGENDAE